MATIFRTNSSSAAMMPQCSICFQPEFHVIFFAFRSRFKDDSSVFRRITTRALRYNTIIIVWFDWCWGSWINCRKKYIYVQSKTNIKITHDNEYRLAVQTHTVFAFPNKSKLEINVNNIGLKRLTDNTCIASYPR